jgi:hypothetical protein
VQKRMRKGIMGCLGGALVLFLTTTVATAHDPTPGSEFNFGGNNPVTFHRAGSPGPWWADAVQDELENKFHDSTDNNSKVPSLAWDANGTGTVTYSSAPTSPCGSGSPIWLQCALFPNHNEYWHIYVRNLSSGGPTGWTWREETGDCQGHPSTCWHIHRALIHEAGHAMFGFPDYPCGLGDYCPPWDDTVMRSNDPEVGTDGSLNWTYQRCDEAESQLLWDVLSYSGPYGDCLDDLNDLDLNGMLTFVSVSGSSFYACNNQSVTVSGRLEVKDFASYGVLGGNPLAGRTVWFERGATTRYTSTTANATVSGSNWSKSIGGSNATFTFTAHFDDAAGDGLDDSNNPTFTITWGPAC